MDDVIQLLHRPDDLEIAVGRHPEAHVDVADHQRRGEAVSGPVGDGEAEDVVGDRDEIVEVAADDLRRYGLSPDVEAGILRDARRKNRRLDPLRFLDERFIALRADALGDDGADKIEGEKYV